MGNTAESPTRPPDSPILLEVKITLYIALGLTGIALVCFGLSNYLNKNLAKTCQKCGGIALILGSLALLIAVILNLCAKSKASTEYLSPIKTVPKTSNKKLIIISADSWCKFSEKMSDEVSTLQSLLEPMGVEVVLVSDKKDKDKFQKLSAQHSAQGFPHSVLLVDETKIADIPGYMTASKMKEIVSSKL